MFFLTSLHHLIPPCTAGLQWTSSLSKAALLACALNRTLVMPVLLIKDEVTKGACPHVSTAERLYHHVERIAHQVGGFLLAC